LKGILNAVRNEMLYTLPIYLYICIKLELKNKKFIQLNFFSCLCKLHAIDVPLQYESTFEKNINIPVLPVQQSI